jgi:hypothetical protein
LKPGTHECEWEGVTCEEGDEVGFFTVTALNLPDSGLYGPIPPETGLLRSLVALGLPDNALMSTLPPELSQLPALEHLDVWTNQLEGTIPVEWGSLT